MGTSPLCQRSELLKVTTLSHRRIGETQSRTLSQDYSYGSKAKDSRALSHCTGYGPTLRMVGRIHQVAESFIGPPVNLSR